MHDPSTRAANETAGGSARRRLAFGLLTVALCLLVFAASPALAQNCTEGNPDCTCSTPGTATTCFCDAGYQESGGFCVDIDECTAGTDNCDANATCGNTAGSFTCTCNSGYAGNGVTCNDVNECTAGTDNCSANAICTNTTGGFTCACSSGYSGNGVTCNDINECTAGTDNCDTNAFCTNTAGSFTCACNTGYSGDGVTCADIDECAAGTDNCDANASCSNTAGGFDCTCNSGYSGDGVTCADIDECATGTDNCDPNATCTNTAGSFTCACNSGFDDQSGGAGTTCTDIDECATGADNCHPDATCTNTSGSFTCACNPGYSGDGVTCSDIDECTLGTFACDTTSIAPITCENTPGAWDCVCGPGFVGDGAVDCGIGSNPPCCATCLDPPADLVAWWPASDDFQDVADPIDGHPGTGINGTGFGTGRVGRAFVLDGIDDFIDVADDTELELGDGDFTIAAWVKLTGDGPHRVIDRLTGDGADFQLIVSGGGSAAVRACFATSGTTDECWDAAIDLTDDQWHQIIAVRDASGADDVRLYVNGLDVGATSAGSVAAPPATGAVRLGTGLTGSIDEPMLFSRALTADEAFDMHRAEDGLCQECEPLALTATGWWRGNGDAQDSIGGNAGSLGNGVGFVSGKVGQAFSFDGSDDFVDVPDAVNLQLEQGDFSIMAWVRLTGAGDYDLVDKLSGPAANDWRATGYIFNVTSAGVVRLCYTRPNLANGISCWDAVGSVIDGDWHHVAAVKSGEGENDVAIYVDGVDAAASRVTFFPPTSPVEVRDQPTSMRIGSRHDGSAVTDGEIDELLLFRTALSASEVLDIAAAGAGVCENACEPGQANCSCVEAPCECAPGFVGDGTTCCLPIYDGIVAWWPGQDNANDSSGTNHGSFPADEYTVGYVDRAFDLSDTTDGIEVPDAPELRLEAGDFSITAWIRGDVPPPGDTQTLLDSIRDQNASLTYAGYQVLVVSGDEPDDPFGIPGVVRVCYAAPDLGGSGVDGRRCYQGSTPVTDGSYHHLAVVKTGFGDGDDIKIYIDGVLSTSQLIGFTGQDAQNTSRLTIGARHGGTESFDGILDELMLFGRPLSAGEIGDLHAADQIGFCPNECASGTDTCDPVATCSDTLDGFACACPPGYFGDGFVCTLLCAEGNSDCVCSTPGDPDTCRCAEGFIGDGDECVDRDECAEGIDNCSPLAACNNEPGGFSCECVVGSGDGVECFACIGYDGSGGETAPIAHWPGDRTPVDVSGGSLTTYANQGASIDAAYQCTAFDHGFLLDGTNDRIEVEDSTALQLESGDFTISAWVRLDGTGQVDIIDKLTNPTGFCELATTTPCLDDSQCPGGEICQFSDFNYVENGYSVTVLSGLEPDELTGRGLVRACYSTSSIGGRRCYQGTTDIADGRSHHVAVVKTGTGAGDDVRIYIDGVDDLASFVQFAVFDPSDNDVRTDLWIGGRQADVVPGAPQPLHFWQGVIDEVALFDRPLSATQVLDITEAATGICKSECDPSDPGCVCDTNGFQCTCSTGWEPVIGGGCANINECALGIDTCRRDDLCFDTQGSFICDNRNECVEDFNACGDPDALGADCTNIAGGFTCACSTGFSGVAASSGINCIDDNECDAGQIGATTCGGIGRPCINLDGSYTCGCPGGDHGDGITCLDCSDPLVTPKSWWRFDGNLLDSQSGFHGSATGPAFEPGKVLEGLDMSASPPIRTELNAGHTPTRTFVQNLGWPYIDVTRTFADVTASTWVKTNGAGFLFRRGSQGEASPQPYAGFSLKTDGAGNLRACRAEDQRYRYYRWYCFRLCTRTFFGFCTRYTTFCYSWVDSWSARQNICTTDGYGPAVNDNQWHNVGVFTGVGDRPHLYIDGSVTTGSTNGYFVGGSSFSTPLYLGEGAGLMDEALVFNGNVGAATLDLTRTEEDGICRDQCAPGQTNCTCDGQLCYCPTGFDFDGVRCIDTSASCPDGEEFFNGACRDINECLGNPCGPTATCTNTVLDATNPQGFICSCEDDKYGNGLDCFDCFQDEGENGLISHWPGEGQPNDVAGDSNGSFPAATYTTGQFGQAFDFDGGAQSFVQVADTQALRLEGASLTLSAWVRVDGTGEVTILDKIADDTGADVHSGYRLSIIAGDAVARFCYSHPEIEGQRCFLGSTNLRDGQFHHLAVTKTGVGDCDDVRIYVDGVDDQALIAGPRIPHPTASTGTLRIGARHGGAAATVGVIDEVAIFGRALSAGEVRTLRLVTEGLCRDECSPDEPGCTCTDIECQCDPGYLSSGGTCIDIDECDEENPKNDCDPDATCVNSEGGFACECNEGFFDFSGDGTVCVDECSPGQPLCQNVDGHFRCEPGYIGDGVTCSDLDECATGRDDCPDPPLANCENTIGSFTCTCAAGFADAAGDGSVCEERWPVIGCGGGTTVVVNDIVTASSGNVYATGTFTNLGLFGTISLIGTVDPTLFVVKYDPAGKALWAKSVPTTPGQQTLGRGIALDENENVYVVGAGSGNAEFIPGIVTDLEAQKPHTGGFVASLDSNGNWRWVRSVITGSGTNDVSVDAIAALPTDPANGLFDDTRLYVAGTTVATATLQGSSRTVSAGSFIATLDVGGTWREVGGGETSVTPIRRIAVQPRQDPGDPNSLPSIYVTGVAPGTTNVAALARFRFSETTDTLVSVWGPITLAGADPAEPYDVEALYPSVFVGGPGFLGAYSDEETGAGLQWETSGKAPTATLRALSLVETPSGPELFVAGDYQTLLEVDLQGGTESFDDPTGTGDMLVARVEGGNGSWLWATNATAEVGFVRPVAISNNGAAAQIAGVFQLGVEFPAADDPLVATCGTDETVDPRPTETFIAQADGSSGDWVSFGEFLVGQEVTPPPGSFTGNTVPPTVIVNGSIQDTADYFFWSPPSANIDGSGKIYITRPAGVIEIQWPVDADPNNQQRKTKVGTAVYPSVVCTESTTGPCVQLHVSGAPVDTDPPDNSRKAVRVVNQGAEFSGAELQAGSFNAPVAGWSVVEFGLGGSVDTTQVPVEYEVVRTVDYRDLDDFDPERLVLAQECTIGTPLENAQIAGRPFADFHDEFTPDAGMRTGHVINPTAFYDGTGPAAAYSRANRTGTIIPVNRVSSTLDRPQDAGKDLAVAWYRKSARGIFWPSRAVEYQCSWPTNPERIVISSQLGNELPGQDVLHAQDYPQLQLYVQNDVALAGYNPNDVHALIRPSNSDPTTGADAIFALRDFVPSPTLPSDPYVLAKYVDPTTGRWAFKVYEVEAFDVVDYPDMRIEQFVGEPIRPIYPMNLLPGCGELTTVRGEQPGDLQPPVPFYRDHTGRLWARAAGVNNQPHTTGTVRFNYPLQDGFYDPVRTAPECVGFLDELPEAQGGNEGALPADTVYTIRWPEGETPLLTVGETLMKQKRGLPNIMNQAATAVAYDELQYRTLVLNQLYDPRESLVRLFRPLTTITVPLTQLKLDAAELATDFAEQGKKSISGNAAGDIRLTPTVSRRLRFNPLARSCAIVGGVADESNCIDGALEFRGMFDDTLAGEAVLIPNVMTDAERVALKKLDGGDGTEAATSAPDFEACFPKDLTIPTTRECSWDQAIEALYHLSRNPDRLALHQPDFVDCSVTTTPPGIEPEVTCLTPRTWSGAEADGPAIGFQDPDNDGIVDPGRVLGTNAALTAGFARGTGKVTLVFNDDPSLTGLPVSLEVIDVGCLTVASPGSASQLSSPYQGQINVIDPENVFDEQVTLRHSGDFAGRSDQVMFEWYIQADVDGRPPEVGECELNSDIRCVRDHHCPTGAGACVTAPVANAWEAGPSGMGLTEITLGSPDFDLPPVRSLADNWFLVHYMLPETEPGVGVCNSPPEWSIFAGQPSTPLNPQGQLAEGWIKRVIKALNPFDARVRAFHKSATNTIASALAQAGERFEGPIALNNDPNNLNSIGLIEAYETVKRRALTLSRGQNFAPAHNAILLISTRISDLYMLLANEAFMDAQDPTIGIRTDSEVIGTGSLAPAIFNFENQVASLLEEELVLLRGRDNTQTGVVARPVYNRFFWNFTTGQGEVAYALSYNISDINADGFLDEFDARILYPQGHGDAWGHYLTALQSHYNLLRLPDQDFRWVPRPEAIRVAGTPVQVDFFDERKFARAAAAKATVGAEIVDLTYRNEYVEDVEGQWQGYKDTDADRAWGLSGWARRAGQGAYYDWLTANAILPAEGGTCDDDPTERCNTDGDCPSGVCTVPVGIQRIDRTTVDELGEIADGYDRIQAQLDEADKGLNPLGLAKGVVPFDIDPAQVDAGKTHFEQIYDRAVAALNNAIQSWNYANLLSRKLRNNQDSVEDLAINSRSTETDFRNRMIEVFGTPYPDDIGPGKTYPDGYNGPDLYHWQYIDLVSLAGERLDEADLMAGTFDDQGELQIGGGKIKVFKATYTPGTGNNDGFLFGTDPESCGEFPFGNGCTLGNPPAAAQKDVDFVLWDSPQFGLAPVKPPSWTGQRRVTGKIQMAWQEVATSQLALKRAIRQYDDLGVNLEWQFGWLQTFFDTKAEQLSIANTARNKTNAYATALKVLAGVSKGMHAASEGAKEVSSAFSECPPTTIVAGLAVGSDAGNVIQCTAKLTGTATSKVFKAIAVAADISSDVIDVLQSDVGQQAGLRAQLSQTNLDLLSLVCNFETDVRKEPLLRAEMFQRAQAVQQSQEKFRNALAEGLRLFDGLVAFRKRTASAIQEYRYEDMGFRIFKTDALQKYRASFDLAAQYTFLAAAAYDYDTNLLGTDVQAGQSFLRDIVRQRNLGQVVLNKPVPGSRGLTDPLGRMEQNFAVLKGQMGFNNPQVETNRFSLREENFDPRLTADPSDDAAWRDKLEAFVVDDIWDSAEFRRFARPFAPEPPADCVDGGPIPCQEPAIVIPFDTTVTFALNFFGLPLQGGDSAYDPSNFSTRIRAAGVWFDGYPTELLSQTPRVYLMPVGEDVLRASGATNFETRQWAVFDQVLPVPFAIGESDLSEEDWIPSDSLSGSFGEIRRFSSMRAYPLSGVGDPVDPSEFVTDSRLIGRSVWNTRWVLIIPAGTLLNDREQGLQHFLDNVKDVQFFFQTYAYQGD